jgi:hypothetical protein
MILDKNLVFSEAQAVTGTADSTNVIDLGNAGDDLSKLNLFVRTKAAFNTLTNITVSLKTSADDSTYVTLYASTAIPLSALTANTTQLQVRLPRTGVLRYLKLVYTVAGTSATLGTIDAYITPEITSTFSTAAA